MRDSPAKGIAQNGANDGGAHDIDQPLAEGKDADDQFGRIAKGGEEDPAKLRVPDIKIIRDYVRDAG